MTNKKRRLGFTIVELVIVIAVIAILAAVLIPTFVNITKKANLSADMVAVKEMNTILAAEEITEGKPATVVDAQEVLKSNGINDFTPMSSNNVFYWVGTENRIVLWTWDSAEKTTGKIVYPEEYEKKYKLITMPSSDWSNLVDDYEVLTINPTEEETLRDALLNTIKTAEDGVILQLPEGSTVDLGAGGLYFLGSYMKNAGGTGKNLTIDLNGGKIESLTPHSNGHYYGGFVPSSGSLTLINGSIEAAGYINGFDVEAGAHLILRDIEFNVPAGDAIFPAGNAAEIILENCKIVAGDNYAIATNNQMSDNIYIKVTNTTLQAPSCALLVNVPCDIIIEDSTIIGGGWGMIVRSGHATIKNSTIKTTDGDTGTNDSRYNTSCEYFVYNSSDSNIPYWGDGAQVPYAPLIVGDYSNHNSYNHDTECNLINVIFANANSTKVPNVVVAARPEGKDVALNYDNTTNIGRVVIFGEGYVRNKFIGLDGKTVFGINHEFKHNGTITINGNAKTYTGSVSSPIVTKTFSNRYTIPTEIGTFAAYKFYSISTLSGDVLEAFKAHYTAQGLNLTEAQWLTVQFAAGGTDNIIKTITYDSSAQ